MMDRERKQPAHSKREPLPTGSRERVADKPIQRRGKILYSLTILMLLAGLVPLLLTGVQLMKTNRLALTGLERTYQTDQTQSIAQQTRLYLQALHNQVLAIARTIELGGDQNSVKFRIQSEIASVQNSDGSSNGSRLGNLIQERSHFHSIRLYSAEGEWANAGLVPNDDQIMRYFDQAFFEARAGKPWVSPAYVWEEPLSDTVVLISAPIFAYAHQDAPRDVVGVVSVLVSLEPIQQLVDEMSGQGREVYIVDGQGQLVIHSEREKLFKKRDFSSVPIVRAFQQSERNFAENLKFSLVEGGETREMVGTYNGIADAKATAPFLRHLDWGAIVHADEETIFYSVSEMESTTVQVAFFSAALCVLLAFVFAQRLSNPITHLAESARRLAAGDFSQNILVSARNEIGELAHTFNLMTAEIRSYIDRIQRAAEENKHMFMGAVSSLAAAIDAKDPYTRGHSERVSCYAEQIALKLGLPENDVEIVRISALMHDVGKIGIEDKILGKAGPLTEEEYEIMKTHPVKGAVIMEHVPQLKAMIPGMKYHHENVNGTGYPEGLKGDEIPLTAKIVSVADTFDAMTTNRPYQKAMELSYVLNRMRSFIGKKFDKEIVEALIQAYDENLIQPNVPVRRSVVRKAPGRQDEPERVATTASKVS